MTANTVASRKAKGMKHQLAIIETLRKYYPELDEDDLRSVPGSVPGEDIWMSPKAKEMIKFSIEAKAQESLAIWECLKQSEDPKRKGIPLLVFRRNHSETYACLKFETLLKLLKGEK